MRTIQSALVLFLSIQMTQINGVIYTKLIGVYSICLQNTEYNNNNSSNNKNLNQEAYITNQTIYNQLKGLLKNKYVQFEYQSFDVCYNETRLKHLFIDFILDEEYYHKRQPHQPLCKNAASCTVPNIVILIAYVPEHFSKIIDSLTTGFSEYTKLCLPMGCGGVYYIPKQDYQEMIKSLEQLKWHNVLYLHLYSQNTTDNLTPIYKENYDYMVKTKRFCSKAMAIRTDNTLNFKRTLSPIVEMCRAENRALVIICDEETNDKLLNQFNDSVEFRQLNVLFYNYLNLDEEVTKYAPKNWLNIDNAAFLKIFDRRYTKFNAGRIANFIEISFLYFTIYIQLECDARDDECRNTPTKRMYNEVWKDMNLLTNETYSLYKTNPNFTVRCPAAEKSPCPSLVCRPGYQKVFVSSINDTTSLIHRIDSMRCVQCPPNHFKADYGDNICRKCTSPKSVHNGDRTGCLDIFTDVQLQLAPVQRIIVASLGALGLILDSVILSVFVMKRATPRVRTSDVVISCTQLAVLLILHLSLILVYVDTTLVFSKCIARNLMLTVLYAANIGLVFTKSQKLLDAYLSKTRVSQSSIRRTTAQQIFTVVLHVVVFNAVLCVLYFQTPPTIDSYLDHVTRTRVYFCVTSSNDDVIFIFVIGGQLACLMQAFRGRNLPSHMNDSMSILYAVFISTVTVATSYPIIHYQKLRSDKDFVRCILVLTNSFVYVLFLYGYRFAVIVFQPHKNTKLYFIQKCRKQVFSNNGLINQQ